MRRQLSGGPGHVAAFGHFPRGAVVGAPIGAYRRLPCDRRARQRLHAGQRDGRYRHLQHCRQERQENEGSPENRRQDHCRPTEKSCSRRHDAHPAHLYHQPSQTVVGRETQPLPVLHRTDGQERQRGGALRLSSGSETCGVRGRGVQDQRQECETARREPARPSPP